MSIDGTHIPILAHDMNIDLYYNMKRVIHPILLFIVITVKR